MYLLLSKKNFYVALIPALFMTWNIFTYILSQPIGFGMDLTLSYWLSIGLTILWTMYFYYLYRKNSENAIEIDHQIGSATVSKY